MDHLILGHNHARLQNVKSAAQCQSNCLKDPSCKYDVIQLHVAELMNLIETGIFASHCYILVWRLPIKILLDMS